MLYAFFSESAALIYLEILFSNGVHMQKKEKKLLNSFLKQSWPLWINEINLLAVSFQGQETTICHIKKQLQNSFWEIAVHGISWCQYGPAD